MSNPTVTYSFTSGTTITASEVNTNFSDLISWISGGNIDSTHIAAGGVDAAELATSAVTTAKIAADAVTNAKIADDQIDSEHIVAGAIDSEHFSTGCIDTAGFIANDLIDSQHYAAGSIDTEHIAAENVTEALCADDVFAQWRVARSWKVGHTQTATTQYVIDSDDTVSDVTNNSGYRGVFYFDPADYTLTTRTTASVKLRISAIVGATAPAQTLAAKLYPVSAIVAGVPTLGSVTDTATTSSLSANTTNQAVGTGGSISSAGYYCVVLEWGATATAATTGVQVDLLVRAQ